jgi:hypothetical protein
MRDIVETSPSEPGFKPHPPHHYGKLGGGFIRAMSQHFRFLKSLSPLKSQTNSNPASIRVQASCSVLATFETYSS